MSDDESKLITSELSTTGGSVVVDGSLGLRKMSCKDTKNRCGIPSSCIDNNRLLTRVSASCNLT